MLRILNQALHTASKRKRQSSMSSDSISKAYHLTVSDSGFRRWLRGGHEDTLLWSQELMVRTSLAVSSALQRYCLEKSLFLTRLASVCSQDCMCKQLHYLFKQYLLHSYSVVILCVCHTLFASETTFFTSLSLMFYISNGLSSLGWQVWFDVKMITLYGFQCTYFVLLLYGKIKLKVILK